MPLNQLTQSTSSILEERSRLLLELAKLYSAGIDPAGAFDILAKGSPHEQQIRRSRQLCNEGAAVWKALDGSQLLSMGDTSMIRSIENTGDLQSLFSDLGNRYVMARNRLNRIKSRLYLPFAVLVLGLIASGLPLLINGEIGTVELLIRTGLPVATIVIGFRVLSRIALPESRDTFTVRLLKQLPILKRYLIRAELRDILFGLSALLRAGLPAAEAVLIMGNSAEPHSELSRKLRRISLKLNNGNAVADSFENEELIDDSSLNALIHTGEASGKLPEMLGTCAKQLGHSLELQSDIFSEWLPRLIYVLVGVWVVQSLF